MMHVQIHGQHALAALGALFNALVAIVTARHLRPFAAAWLSGASGRFVGWPPRRGVQRFRS
jgi:hypothetical protein